MKISGESFLGFNIPSIPIETTNFNSSPYGELDILNSFLRGKELYINTGKDSDEQETYVIAIEGLGDVEKEIGYYTDSIFVWGKWKIFQDGDTSKNLKNDFIGIVTGHRKGSAQFYLKLNPEKASAE